MEKDVKFVVEDLIDKAHERIDRLGELKAHLNSLIENTADTELMICYRELRNKVETFIGWDTEEVIRLETEAKQIQDR
jgi:hypothetical protein